jgi:hypothetical protein
MCAACLEVLCADLADAAVSAVICVGHFAYSRATTQHTDNLLPLR